MAHAIPFSYGIYGVTFVCGMIDAACFLGLERAFAEIMTGNLVLLAFVVGSGHSIVSSTPTVIYPIAIGVFALGCLVGGRLVRLSSRWAHLRIGFIVVWCSVVASTALTAILHPGVDTWSSLAVFAVMTFGMGIQNVMIRAWGIPDLATNVMTLTLTSVIADWRIVGGDNNRASIRISSIAIFVVSAALGAYLVRFGVLWALLLVSILYTLALPVLVLAPHEPR